ncbi:IS630 family transposase [Spirosoma panaciterrae]|uniref:IS630 family transposase n=1 Tax=Spirosoma panaciterrae TaxID=496058 RepID=UPI001FE0E46B|nr:IS630 family transposase [Spirosoma panaciterrae]
MKSVYQASKKAQAEGRGLVYIDESACYLLPLVAHTWAKKGETPVLVEQAGRDHLSLIAAIAPNGRLYVGGQDRPFRSEDVIWFLERLCSRYRKRNLLVVWDGAAIHRSQAIKDWLSRKAGRVHLERLPAYSPELNPVELFWSHLKRKLKNQVFVNFEQLLNAILYQLDQLQVSPKLITAFFRKKEIAFFTD